MRADARAARRGGSTLARRGAASYDRHMTRRAVRTIWILTGLCLVAGVVVSASLWVGAPDRPWQHAMKELSTLLDVVALLLGMEFSAACGPRRRPPPCRRLISTPLKPQRAGTPRGPRRASQVAIPR